MIEWFWTWTLTFDFWKFLLTIFLLVNFKNLPLVFHVSISSDADKTQITAIVFLYFFYVC